MKKFFSKLHLWLAVPFGLVIMLLCLSGAILVFESEIKELTQPSLYNAYSASGDVLPFGEIIAKAKSQLPDTIAISSIQIPSSDKKNYRLGVEGQKRTSILIDPYTGDVKGVVRPYEKGSFFTLVRRLHRWFLMEVRRDGISWGKMITGVSTLVFVFILISGIIIWIPKTMKGLKKRLMIKRGAGRFRFWYDFHLSLGKMASLVLLVMALTGLTWSFSWYRDGFYKVFGVEVTQGAPHVTQQPSGGGGDNCAGGGRPKSGREEVGPAGAEGGRGERTVGDNAQHGKQSERGGRSQGAGVYGGHSEGGESERGGGRPGGAQRGGRSEGGRGDGERVNYAVWETAVAAVKESNHRFRSVTVQDGTVSVANNRYGNTRASDSYTFDRRTGGITGVTYYRDQPRSAKIRGWIYAVHVGSWGGIYTKVIYFVVCLIGAALPVTGYYIWLKKRWKRWARKKKPITAV